MVVDMIKVNIEISFLDVYIWVYFCIFFWKNIVKMNKGNFIVIVIKCYGWLFDGVCYIYYN